MTNEIPQKIKDYYTALDGWMLYFGMTPIDTEPNWLFDKAYRRAKFQASKFGESNTYAMVKYYPAPPETNILQRFSSESFNYAMSLPKGAPVGMGAHLVAYPLLVVDSITNELYQFIKTYCPKHFASAEFPGILDISTNELYFYPDTPVWGAFYYGGYRSDIYNFFSPKAWERIKEK